MADADARKATGARAMEVRQLCAIVAVAFALRLLAVIVFPLPLASDAIVYERLAWRVAQGLGYTNDNGVPTAFYPPLYSYVVGALYAVFGRVHGVIYLAQALLSALLSLAVYDIARRIWHRRDVALAAALLVALDFAFVLYPRVFYTETLFTALLAVAMVAWVRAWQTDHLGAWLVFAVATGLATLTRPPIQFLPVIAIAAWPWRVAGGGLHLDRARLRRGAVVTAVVLGGFVVTLAPWWVRNAVLFGRVTTEITSSTGTGLYISYFPMNGWQFALTDPHDPLWAGGLQVKRQGTLQAEWERSAYMSRGVKARLREDPMRIVKLVPLKLAYLAWPYDWTLFNGVGRLDVTYVFAAPFVILGCVSAVRQRHVRAGAPLWLLLAYTVVITVVFLGGPRYRAPVQPFLYVVAALGLCAFTARRPRAVWWVAIWAGVVVILAIAIPR